MSSPNLNEPLDRQTLNIPEVAQLLGCSRGSAYRWAREGRIPALRVGRRLVVPRQAFEEWLASAAEPLIQDRTGQRSVTGGRHNVS